MKRRRPMRKKCQYLCLSWNALKPQCRFVDNSIFANDQFFQKCLFLCQLTQNRILWFDRNFTFYCYSPLFCSVNQKKHPLRLHSAKQCRISVKSWCCLLGLLTQIKVLLTFFRLCTFRKKCFLMGKIGSFFYLNHS